MEYAAIRHFADRRYCYAAEKGRFCIRLETKRDDIESVVLHTQDKYLPIERVDTRQTYKMERVCSDAYLDYYEAWVEMDLVCLRYFFELSDFAGTVRYYGNHAFYGTCISDIEKMYDCPQTLREEECFELPAWARNRVVYQIFPARFATDRDVDEKTWYQAPISHTADLKGSLRGIINRLDYLKKLGVDILYMTPVFLSRSTHKYDTSDYYRIDPSFGTTEDLRELVSRAHAMGMYVILDGVFNHTAANFFAFEDLKNREQDSGYLNWYYPKAFPLTAERGQKPGYKTFSYAAGMPKLNLQNKETADYIIDVARYWIVECDIDGWRLDVADEISHTFWKRFRREIKAVKKDALIVGEIWHFAGDFVEGDEWDSFMNYHFYRAVLDLVANETMRPSDFADSLGFMRGNLHCGLTGYLWNMIDSHDTARFLHSCGHDLKKQRLAAALQLLLPGMPMICYGDEVSLAGGPDPDCRRGMLWDENRQNTETLRYYRTLLQIRHEQKALTEGIVCEQYTDDENGIIYIKRQKGDSEITLLFHTKAGCAELPELAGMRELVTGQDFSGRLCDYETAVLIG